MMIFRKFEPTQSTATGGGVPTVRIRSEGRIILNAAAKRALGEETEFVSLLWDDETNRFGIQPTDEADQARVRIVHATSQSIITSKAFVHEHSLPIGQRMRLEREGDMWVASTLNPSDPLEVAST